MIREKTLLILGAGASAHCGYPVGEFLVKEIEAGVAEFINGAHVYAQQIASNNSEDKLKQNLFGICYEGSRYKGSGFKHGTNYLGGSTGIQGEYIDALKQFRERLSLQSQFSIDEFLAQNPEYAYWGKVLIAWKLLKCQKSIFTRETDWYRYLLHSITTGVRNQEQLLTSLKNLFVVNFNYDLSYEYAVHKRLSATQIFEDVVGEAFQIVKQNTHHVYGKLYELAPSRDEGLRYHGNHSLNGEKVFELVDLIKEAARSGIRVINERAEDECKSFIEGLPLKFEHIYAFGFAFDRQNLNVINFENLVSEKRCENFYYTNLDSHQRIERILDQYRFRDKRIGSTHKVYEALQKDFSLPQ